MRTIADCAVIIGGYALVAGTIASAFANVWDSSIKPKDMDKYGWEANPWVWVIEFERCERPECQEHGQD